MFCDKLMDKAASMGIILTPEMVDKLNTYHRMLLAANAQMNLTRVPDDEDEAIDRNYLDSLAPLGDPTLLENAKTLIDVGSGAGFPGLPLAIAKPDLQVTLLDSLKKRVEFLRSVIRELGLNTEVVHGRAEDMAKDPEYRARYDIATARAVAGLNTLYELTLPFARVGGKLIAYKGPTADEEIEEGKNALFLLGGADTRSIKVVIHGRDWDHRLVICEKRDATPDKYPRKAGEPARKPL